jgi:hypothetical protein
MFGYLPIGGVLANPLSSALTYDVEKASNSNITVTSLTQLLIIVDFMLLVVVVTEL